MQSKYNVGRPIKNKHLPRKCKVSLRVSMHRRYNYHRARSGIAVNIQVTDELAAKYEG